jgi:hypothetical protein
VSEKNSELLVLDAGHFEIKSTLCEEKETTASLLTKSFEELVKSAYDDFSVKLTNFTVFSC